MTCLAMKIDSSKIGWFFCGIISMWAISYLIPLNLLNKDTRTRLPEPSPHSEPLVTLKGKLKLQLFTGPPEYSSIENGDRIDHCWVLELDNSSFLLALNAPSNELSLDLGDVLRRSDANQVMLGRSRMGDICPQYENQVVIVRGRLFHAHTIHHYTPLLMDMQEIHLAP